MRRVGWDLNNVLLESVWKTSVVNSLIERSDHIEGFRLIYYTSQDVPVINVLKNILYNQISANTYSQGCNLNEKLGAVVCRT